MSSTNNDSMPSPSWSMKFKPSSESYISSKSKASIEAPKDAVPYDTPVLESNEMFQPFKETLDLSSIDPIILASDADEVDAALTFHCSSPAPDYFACQFSPDSSMRPIVKDESLPPYSLIDGPIDPLLHSEQCSLSAHFSPSHTQLLEPEFESELAFVEHKDSMLSKHFSPADYVAPPQHELTFPCSIEPNVSEHEKLPLECLSLALQKQSSSCNSSLVSPQRVPTLSAECATSRTSTSTTRRARNCSSKSPRRRSSVNNSPKLQRVSPVKCDGRISLERPKVLKSDRTGTFSVFRARKL